MTTQAEISNWFDEGVKRGASHMIVVCDTFDWEDYPVYCTDDANVLEKYQYYKFDAEMQKVMEVYDLRISKDEQFKLRRVLNLPSPQAS